METDDTQHRDTHASIPNIIHRQRPWTLHSGDIAPGQDVDRALVYHAMGSSTVNLRGLVIASSVENEDDIASAPVAFALDVRSAINIASSSQPSRIHLGQHVLTIEITNVAERPLKLDHLSVISPVWKGDAVSRSVTRPQNFASVS